MKRQQWEIMYKNGLWHGQRRRHKVFSTTTKKSDAIWYVVTHLRMLLVRDGIRSELTIHKMDGGIQDKRTYGDDPRRSRG